MLIFRYPLPVSFVIDHHQALIHGCTTDAINDLGYLLQVDCVIKTLNLGIYRE